jgi:UDP:flavonoid glycosyltransferase YjiC (YdhE family)
MRVALLTWDGGGNVSVALGVAAALAARRHSVTLIGPRSLRSSVTTLGLGFRELGVDPPADGRSRADYLAEVVESSALAPRLAELVGELGIEILVVDCNLAWALDLDLPVGVAVLVHTALGLYLPAWQAVLDAVNERRATAGLTPFARALDAWSARDLVLVTSVTDFDTPPSPRPPHMLYVGPVFDPRRPEHPPPDIRPTAEPLVLVTYSTDALQNSAARVQVAVDALAALPVRALVTTSGLFDARLLSLPPNATAVEYLRHRDVMPMLALVVGHAGHGTTLAALTGGVPLVCVPGLGRDQLPIARRVERLRLGAAVTDPTSVEAIRAAAAGVLDDPGYRRRARRFQRRWSGLDGGATAAAALESLETA